METNKLGTDITETPKRGIAQPRSRYRGCYGLEISPSTDDSNSTETAKITATASTYIPALNTQKSDINKAYISIKYYVKMENGD